MINGFVVFIEWKGVHGREKVRALLLLLALKFMKQTRKKMNVLRTSS